MWYDANDCSIKDAQCVRFSKYCICHCMPGYGLVDDKCLKSNITFLLNNNTCGIHHEMVYYILKFKKNIARKQTYLMCGDKMLNYTYSYCGSFNCLCSKMCIIIVYRFSYII